MIEKDLLPARQREEARMNAIELDFIPCDLHNDTPAVHMEIADNGKIRFTCGTCRDHA